LRRAVAAQFAEAAAVDAQVLDRERTGVRQMPTIGVGLGVLPDLAGGVEALVAAERVADGPAGQELRGGVQQDGVDRAVAMPVGDQKLVGPGGQEPLDRGVGFERGQLPPASVPTMLRRPVIVPVDDPGDAFEVGHDVDLHGSHPARRDRSSLGAAGKGRRLTCPSATARLARGVAMPMTLLHFADTHLGQETYGRMDPATGLHTRLTDFSRCLHQVVDASLEAGVDAALFAGDAYRNCYPSPTHQQLFAAAIGRWCRRECPW